ncbi:MAG TPA: glycosyltransferase family 39 protein, partial [Cryomorphaceae bacterium]|nr:glycosyltransferase family 39 protein [Cryomorphaceae bacterium]
TQSETHYLFNPYHLYLSPPSYGVGFPLLLAPIYAFFGNDIYAFVIFINFALVLFLLLHFKYLRRQFNFAESFIITLVLAFIPKMLRLKGEVISDIPFALVISACLLLYSKYRTSQKPATFLAIGLLAGYAMLIRSVGFLIIIAFTFDQIVLFVSAKNFGKKSLLKNSTPIALTIISCALVYVVLGMVVYPAKQESFSFFSELFFTNPIGDQVREGLEYYFLQLEKVFNPEADKWQFTGILLKSFVIVMLVLGLFNKLTKRPNFGDYFFLMYMGVIILFPVYSQGFRYLLPVLPIASGYVITGFRSVQFERKINRNIIYFICCISVYYAFKKEVQRIDRYYPISGLGPQTEHSKEIFQFIRKNSAEDDIIVFNKPRVLGLYAQRDSYALYPEGDLTTTKSQLHDLGWNYILTSTELPDPAIDEFIKMNSAEIDQVFANERFVLYRKK